MALEDTPRLFKLGFPCFVHSGTNSNQAKPGQTKVCSQFMHQRKTIAKNTQYINAMFVRCKLGTFTQLFQSNIFYKINIFKCNTKCVLGIPKCKLHLKFNNVSPSIAICLYLCRNFYSLEYSSDPNVPNQNAFMIWCAGKTTLKYSAGL